MNSTYIEIAIIAYVLGSIPFGYILVRLFRKQDIRSVGSGNIGATNVVRSGAKGLGALTLLLDAAKGYAAVYIAKVMAHATHSEKTLTTNTEIVHTIVFLSLSSAMAVAAIAAILGHVFPVWLRFKGGKGVATALGVFLAIAPKAVGYTLIVFVTIFAVFRIISLASIVSAVVFPVIAVALHRTMDRNLIAAICFISFLIIVKHRGNVKRIFAGTEHRWGRTKVEAHL